MTFFASSKDSGTLCLWLYSYSRVTSGCASVSCKVLQLGCMDASWHVLTTSLIAYFEFVFQKFQAPANQLVIFYSRRVGSNYDQEGAFWSVRTKTSGVRNRSEKRRNPSKIAIASRSTTEYAISLCFRVLEKKPTGLSPWVSVAPIPVPDASVWRTRGSFNRGSQSTAEATYFLRVAIPRRKAWLSEKPVVSVLRAEEQHYLSSLQSTLRCTQRS